MRVAIALLLFVHGFAHLPGFLVPWRLATLKDVPYKTSLLAGRVRVGDKGIRVVGALWLTVALAMAASAIGVLTGLLWVQPATLAVVGGSLLLCIAGWPEARIGVFVNVGLATLVLVAARMRWW